MVGAIGAVGERVGVGGEGKDGGGEGRRGGGRGRRDVCCRAEVSRRLSEVTE